MPKTLSLTNEERIIVEVSSITWWAFSFFACLIVNLPIQSTFDIDSMLLLRLEMYVVFFLVVCYVLMRKPRMLFAIFWIVFSCFYLFLAIMHEDSVCYNFLLTLSFTVFGFLIRGKPLFKLSGKSNSK